MAPASTADYRAMARKRIPRFLFDYVDGGAFAETTLARNEGDLAAVMLRQRVMRDVSSADAWVELFGRRWAMPLALAPVGLAGLNARRGEVQAARAAHAAGIPFTLSTVSACSLEEVAAGTRQPFWFQLYMLRDRDFMRDLIRRARAAGADALVFTVDLPTPGPRLRDVRSGMSGSSGLAGRARRLAQALARPAWAIEVGLLGRPHSLGNLTEKLGARTGLQDFMRWIAANFDPAVTWRDIGFVREEWDGPLIIKGVLDVEDALEARRFGADAIVVSNHGGRQLDGAPSTARALPAIAAALGDAMPILVDGGVRSGLDVLRMLALGARMVMIGRPWVWALGSGAGVAPLLAQFHAEFRAAMALTGVTAAAQIDRRVLLSPPP